MNGVTSETLPVKTRMTVRGMRKTSEKATILRIDLD